LAAQAQSDVSLRLATGPQDDTYRIIGDILRHAVEAAYPHIHIELLSTSNSIDSIEMLERGEADLVLAQDDVIEELSNRYRQSNKALPWRTVLVLTQEPVQIVAGPSMRGDTLDALSARQLALDMPGSATYFTASRILEVLKLEFSELPARSATEVAEALRQHKAQAGFFVSNAPAPQVAGLLADPAFRLLTFHTEEMGILHDHSPYYVTATIPEHTYSNQDRPVATIAVLTVLMCRHDLPDETVGELAKALIQYSSSTPYSVRSQSGLNGSDILRLTAHAAAPLHPGAEQALRTIPLAMRLQAYLNWLQWGLLVLATMFTLSIANVRRPRFLFLRLVAHRLPLWLARPLRRFLFHRLLWRMVRTFSLFMLIWLVGSAVMYQCERDVNTNFSTLKTSSLSILVYLFSGLEDRAPVTNEGWIGSVAMLISGALVAAYITGQFASEIMHHTSGVIKMTRNSAKDSIFVIGWNPRAERVVREMFAAFEVDLPEYRVTVLSDEKVDTSRFSEFESRGVTFVSGDAFDKKLLEQVGAHRAHSVVVMADDNAEDADGKSAMTVLALRSLCREAGFADNHWPRVCVEVKNHRKMDLIRDAGADEVICHQDFGLGVLAQSAFAAKLTDVYQELLSYSVSSCEIYMLSSPHGDEKGDIPEDVWKGLFEGKTFVEAAEVFNSHRDGENPPILIGVKRDGRTLVNPRTRLELKEGDDLIAIAYVRPKLENLRYLIRGQMT